MASVTDAFPDPESAATKKTAARERLLPRVCQNSAGDFP